MPCASSLSNMACSPRSLVAATASLSARLNGHDSAPHTKRWSELCERTMPRSSLDGERGRGSLPRLRSRPVNFLTVAAIPRTRHRAGARELKIENTRDPRLRHKSPKLDGRRLNGESPPVCAELGADSAVNVLVETALIGARVGSKTAVWVLSATLVDVGAVVIRVAPIGPRREGKRADRADIQVVAAKRQRASTELLVVRIAGDGG